MDAPYPAISEIGAGRIQKMIRDGAAPDAIKSIIEKTTDIEPDLDAADSGFLTSLLHYLFTISMVPSQRKVRHHKVELDIVIPDASSLDSNPESTIIICIPGMRDSGAASEVQAMRRIHRTPRNIWYVTESEVDGRRYAIKDGTFYHILDDAIKTDAAKKRLRLFGI